MWIRRLMGRSCRLQTSHILLSWIVVLLRWLQYGQKRLRIWINHFARALELVVSLVVGCQTWRTESHPRKICIALRISSKFMEVRWRCRHPMMRKRLRSYRWRAKELRLHPRRKRCVMHLRPILRQMLVRYWLRIGRISWIPVGRLLMRPGPDLIEDGCFDACIQ